MTPMRRIWLVVVVAAGCGSPDPKVTLDGGGSDAQETPADAHIYTINGASSGTRLKLGWVQTADGMRHLSRTSLDYYDSMREVDCRAEVWANGKTYCTPNHDFTAYSDADCTTPIMVAHGTPPAYLADVDSSGRMVGMYEPGARTPSVTAYYTRSGTACYGPTSEPSDVYAVTPVTDLVELTHAFHGTGTLHDAWYEAADGFAAPRYNKAFDPTLDVACTISWIGSWTGEQLCDPDAAYPTTAYASSDCMTDRLVVTNSADPAPAFGRVPTSQCGGPPDSRVFAVGSPTTPPSIYRKNGVTCSQSAPQPGKVYHPLGSQVGTMVSVPIALDAVAGYRLQPRVYGAGLNVRTGVFYDTVLDLDCGFGAVTGPCLPSYVRSEQSSGRRLYTDVNCTSAIDVVAVADQPGCAPTAAPKFAATTNTYPPELHPVTTEHTAPLYYMTSTSCEPAEWDYVPLTHFYELGPAIPSSAFEQGTYYVDP